MRLSTFALATAGLVAGQNMSSEPLCDKYTTALLKENNATNQLTLLTLLVNTVVIGNYTQPNMNAVPGILMKGEYMGEEVNLAPYFDGTLKSSNRGGSEGVSVNFLDDGGAEPLKKNMPANGMDSNQYKLLTHLYQFFGTLLGCSMQGQMGFPAYMGHDMASAHAFMDITPAENGYFISQVGLAAQSFGVSMDDITAVAGALNMTFNTRCSPAATVIPSQPMTLNSICQNEMCPLDPKANCTAYPNNGTATMPAAVSGSSAPSPTGSEAPMTTGAASQMGVGAMLGLAALAMFL